VEVEVVPAVEAGAVVVEAEVAEMVRALPSEVGRGWVKAGVRV